MEQVITLFFISIGLAMDAFAVSITDGMCYNNFNRKYAVGTAFTFGLFQALMPVIGFFAGRFLSGTISFLDHWIAFILLALIGGSMIFEAIKEARTGDACDNRENNITPRVVLLQGIATSIDAMALGISFALININILLASCMIGIITFIICLVGVFIGKRCTSLLKNRARIFGGLILCAIGLKILIEHLFFGG